MSIALDALDSKAASVFDGYLVRKDLVRRYSRQYPVPTYVVEFLLGRYCASTDDAEIAEGLQIVEKQLKDRTVRTGDEEIFKARAQETGSVKLIDIVKARLDTKNDCYLAELPSLALRDVRIDDRMVRDNERMLTDGFYAEVTLSYDGIIAQQQGGRPFEIDALRPIQMSKSDVLDVYEHGRRAFTTAEWIDFLLRSIGLEPAALTERAKRVALLRMVPFVERNYNLVELGPRGTGKSHLFQQISPYAHLISGGKATVAKMFVNNATGQRGLVCQYDVVCFDEVSGISFDQKDGVNIMKGYMASGQFSRGKENIRADGGIVMVGNLDVDVEQQQRVGHLLSPLPPEMRNDTAFMDRIHAYVPGWDFPKLNPTEHFTDHFGLVSDFLSECWIEAAKWEPRCRSCRAACTSAARSAAATSRRSTRPSAAWRSCCSRIRRCRSPTRISNGWFGSRWKRAGASRSSRSGASRASSATPTSATRSARTASSSSSRRPSCTATRRSKAIRLPPGQVWAVSPGSPEAGPGLYRIEVTCGPGSGVKILNQPTPPPFRESVKVGEQNLYTRAEGACRRPRSARARVLDPDAGDGCGQGRRRPRPGRAGGACGSLARPKHTRRDHRRREPESRRLGRDGPERRSESPNSRSTSRRRRC